MAALIANNNNKLANWIISNSGQYKNRQDAIDDMHKLLEYNLGIADYEAMDFILQDMQMLNYTEDSEYMNEYNDWDA